MTLKTIPSFICPWPLAQALPKGPLGSRKGLSQAQVWGTEGTPHLLAEPSTRSCSGQRAPWSKGLESSGRGASEPVPS